MTDGRIEQKWQEFLRVVRAKEPPEVLQEERRVFFAGALLMLEICQELSVMDKHSYLLEYARVDQELHEFLDSLKEWRITAEDEANGLPH